MLFAVVQFLKNNELLYKKTSNNSVILNFQLISNLIDVLPTWDYLHVLGNIQPDYEVINRCDITNLKSIFVNCTDELLAQAKTITVECPRTANQVDDFLKRDHFIKLCLYSESNILLKVFSGNRNPQSNHVQYYSPGQNIKQAISLYRIKRINLGGLYKPEKEITMP